MSVAVETLPGSGKGQVALRDRFGFASRDGGVHSARTMLFPDLVIAMDHLSGGAVRAGDLTEAIVGRNLLGRRSMSARREAAARLQTLYGLDDRFAIFRALRRLWDRDEAARPVLALLVAMARDGILRSALPFARALAPGERFDVSELDAFLRRRDPGHYSESTRRSISRNIASSWRQAGVLAGVVRKVRSAVPARPASVSLALFLGYLDGARGASLFSTPWMGVFDAEPVALRAAARDANAHDLLRMASLDTVVEISFPGWLNDDERRWLDEQDQAAAG